MAEAQEVSAASPKQCLGGEPERGKTFYGREGHLPSHLVEPPQGKDTPLRGGELQGGDQRGGGWGPGGWGTSGPMLRLRKAHGPQNLHAFKGGGRGRGLTEHQETEGDAQTRRKGRGLRGEDGVGYVIDASPSPARDRSTLHQQQMALLSQQVAPLLLPHVALLSSLSCQARERTTKWGIPQLAFGHTPIQTY